MVSSPVQFWVMLLVWELLLIHGGFFQNKICILVESFMQLQYHVRIFSSRSKSMHFRQNLQTHRTSSMLKSGFRYGPFPHYNVWQLHSSYLRIRNDKYADTSWPEQSKWGHGGQPSLPNACTGLQKDLHALGYIPIHSDYKPSIYQHVWPLAF